MNTFKNGVASVAPKERRGEVGFYLTDTGTYRIRHFMVFKGKLPYFIRDGYQ